MRHPCFDSLVEEIDYRIVGSLVNTDKVMNNFFWIGVYPGMTYKQLNYVVDVVKTFVKKSICVSSF